MLIRGKGGEPPNANFEPPNANFLMSIQSVERVDDNLETFSLQCDNGIIILS